MHLNSGATPEFPSAQYSDYGFIAMLALAQRLHIHFLPITWQAALGPLGEGGQARINQALIHVQTSFAFKCFKKVSQIHNFECALFREVINEMIILSHPLIRNHPHVVRLEGICWDISQDDQVWPVLVFEKAHLGDLDQFVTSIKGTKLSMEDRLDLCVDIGIAIKDMHSNSKEYYTLGILIVGSSDLDIIHGDIKPKNVLVFEHEPNTYVARVADFGYSTRFCGEYDLIKMPISHPWNAPEHHHRGFHASKAKKMDVYSFGVVCLWLLFEGNSSLPPHSQTSWNDGQFASFKDVLKSRTNDDSLLRLSIGLVEEHRDFSCDTKKRLSHFFDCTLTSDPDKRSADFDYLLHLLVPSR
jgi:serine/threonine protein kinase